MLHTMADSFAIREHIDARAPKSAIIVGGGYIGLEMADALRHRGLAVTLFDVGASVLHSVDPELGNSVRVALERHGVEVRLGTPIELIEGDCDGVRVVDANRRGAVADLVLVATGVRPSVELARSAGLATGERGALRVNRAMESSVDGIYAAGDCVETHHRLHEAPTYLALGTTSHKQGRIAGENALGGKVRFEGTLGTQVVKVFDLVIGRTGLRDGEARACGFDPRTSETKSLDHKGYYPGATEMRTRAAADAVGATRLHRPEWVAVHPESKEVFVTLTNGSGNTAVVNSGRDPNPYGHILRFREANDDGTKTTFEWDAFLLAGDPAYDPSVPADQPVFRSPDGLWIDPDGRVWIQTDISNSSQPREPWLRQHQEQPDACRGSGNA
jgi:hypothetical protein